MVFSSTQYHRMKRLNLNPSNRNAKIADMAFNPDQSAGAITQLLDLRDLLTANGIKTKKDLESLLDYFANQKKQDFVRIAVVESSQSNPEQDHRIHKNKSRPKAAFGLRNERDLMPLLAYFENKGLTGAFGSLQNRTMIEMAPLGFTDLR